MFHQGHKLAEIVAELPVVVGFELNEAISLRLGLSTGRDHVTLARQQACRRARVEIERRYQIVR